MSTDYYVDDNQSYLCPKQADFLTTPETEIPFLIELPYSSPHLSTQSPQPQSLSSHISTISSDEHGKKSIAVPAHLVIPGLLATETQVRHELYEEYIESADVHGDNNDEIEKLSFDAFKAAQQAEITSGYATGFEYASSLTTILDIPPNTDMTLQQHVTESVDSKRFTYIAAPLTHPFLPQYSILAQDISPTHIDYTIAVAQSIVNQREAVFGNSNPNPASSLTPQGVLHHPTTTLPAQTNITQSSLLKLSPILLHSFLFAPHAAYLALSPFSTSPKFHPIKALILYELGWANYLTSERLILPLLPLTATYSQITNLIDTIRAIFNLEVYRLYTSGNPRMSALFDRLVMWFEDDVKLKRLLNDTEQKTSVSGVDGGNLPTADADLKTTILKTNPLVIDMPTSSTEPVKRQNSPSNLFITTSNTPSTTPLTTPTNSTTSPRRLPPPSTKPPVKNLRKNPPSTLPSPSSSTASPSRSSTPLHSPASALRGAMFDPSNNNHKTSRPTSSPQSPPNSTQMVHKFIFPAELFPILYLPLTLLYNELIIKNSKLSFSQLIPFSLPSPYLPSDSISLFTSLILMVDSKIPLMGVQQTGKVESNQTIHTNSDTTADLSDDIPSNTDTEDASSKSTTTTPAPTPAPPTTLSPSPLPLPLITRELLAQREAQTGVNEPTAIDCDFFINTHHPRFSATLVFSPLDYLCATCLEHAQGGVGEREEEGFESETSSNRATSSETSSPSPISSECGTNRENSTKSQQHSKMSKSASHSHSHSSSQRPPSPLHSALNNEPSSRPQLKEYLSCHCATRFDLPFLSKTSPSLSIQPNPGQLQDDLEDDGSVLSFTTPSAQKLEKFLRPDPKSHFNYYKSSGVVDKSNSPNMSDLERQNGDYTIQNIPPLSFLPTLNNLLSSAPIPSSYDHLGDDISNTQNPAQIQHLYSSWFSHVFSPSPSTPTLYSPLLYRWLAYNIKQVVLTPQSFYFNSKSVPVLAKPLQSVLHHVVGQLGACIYLVDDTYAPFYTHEPQHISPDLLSTISSPLYPLFTRSRFLQSETNPTHSISPTDVKLIALLPPQLPQVRDLQCTYFDLSLPALLGIYSKTIFYNTDMLSYSPLRYNTFIPFLCASIKNTVYNPPLLSAQCYFEANFRDELQIPLQPLGHQLENATYEVFEKDPVKYRQYQYAIEQMLVYQYNSIKSKLFDEIEKRMPTIVDLVEQSGPTQQPNNQFHNPPVHKAETCAAKPGAKSVNGKRNKKKQSQSNQPASSPLLPSTDPRANRYTVVMQKVDHYLEQHPIVIKVCVLGAGRGPLVQCAIDASHRVNISVDLSAVEKNPYAYCSIIQRCQANGGFGNGHCSACTPTHSIDPYSTLNATPHNILEEDLAFQLLLNQIGMGDEPTTYFKSRCMCSTTSRSNWAHVNVIHSDMRDIIASNQRIRDRNTEHLPHNDHKQSPPPTPHQWHIVVSELLGSFGDNELSPECLYGVEQLLTRPELQHQVNSPISHTNHTQTTEDVETSLKELDVAFSKLFVNLQGFSIPVQSRSFLAPVTASAVYNSIIGHNIGASAVHDKISATLGKPDERPQQPPIQTSSAYHARRNKYLHTPYVTLLHTLHILSQPQETFQFFHPDSKPIYPSASLSHQNISPIQLDQQSDLRSVWNNENMNHPLCRYTKHAFDVSSITSSQSGDIIHGLAGYFDSVLFDPKHIQHTMYSQNSSSECPLPQSNTPANTIGISILPETFSHGMFSWFPLFLPFQIPILSTSLPNHQLIVEVWRKSNGKKVWYEYAVEGQQLIHNYDGLAYSIGLSNDADFK